MRIDKLNDLPDWDDDSFGREDGEEWKPDPTRETCKALYQKWREIVTMLNGALENDSGEEEDPISSFAAYNKQIVLSDAFEVGAKIKSSEAGGIYVLRMENATIIRKHAQSIASSMLMFNPDDGVDENYAMLIRTEIDQFRELFKIWVSTFEKDEYTDDWGLFV